MSLDGHQILLVTDAWEPQVNGVVTTLSVISKKIGIFVFHPGLVKSFKFPLYKEIPICYTFKGLKDSIERANYIHIATEGPLGWYAKLYCDRKKYKYTTSYHTNFDVLLKESYNIPKSITNWFITKFHSKSSRVLVPTKTTAERLNKKGLTQTTVWTRGVDKDLFITRDWKLSIPYKKRLLYVGRISKEKNLEEFLDLELPENHDKIIVGDGPHLAKLKEEYPEAIFLGKKVGKELVDEYRIADVFVFPSKFDTFGLVQIEAMYCGTPVAAYTVEGPRDVIENGITGYTDENLLKAVQKAMTLNRKIVAKRAKENWNWERCCETFLHSLIEKER